MQHQEVQLEQEVQLQLQEQFGISLPDVVLHLRINGKHSRKEVVQFVHRCLERNPSPWTHYRLLPLLAWSDMDGLGLDGSEYRQTYPHDPTKETWIFVGQIPLCMSGSEALMNFLCGIVAAFKLRVTVSCCQPVFLRKNGKEYFRGCAHFLVSRARPLYALNRTILAESSFVYMALDKEQRSHLRKYIKHFRRDTKKFNMRLSTPYSCVTFAPSTNPPE